MVGWWWVVVGILVLMSHLIWLGRVMIHLQPTTYFADVPHSL